MMKKAILIATALLCCTGLFAQEMVSTVKGRVVSRSERLPIGGATVTITSSEGLDFTCKSSQDGTFVIPNVANGKYTISFGAAGYLPTAVNVVLEGYVKDLMFVTLSASQSVNDVDDSSFAEFDMDDSGYTDTPTILFGSSDPYNNVVSYGFSAIRFKNRGYESQMQDVLLAGVKMNDAMTGYSPYSLWSGLNEAMRSTETTNGLESSDYALGGVNGTTNILAVPSAVRTGWRFSVLSNSALYRFRAMATYASGEMDNGWSYAFNVSARLGGNDWVEGLYYRSFAYYFGAEKKFTDASKLSLVTFATPGERGAQNASTQEVYDLMGDNMYNSNWGYQNGKVRNARVRKTFEPVTFLKYSYKPSTEFEADAVALWRTGKNGYTALDWYDAMDPRPDYYRNLPSYFYMDDDDYNRVNYDKAAWAKEAWTNRSASCINYQHVNWDRLYDVNYNSADGRSKYIQEERRVDQNEIDLAATFKNRFSERFTLKGGASWKWNRTENYKIVADLLGGEYYLNVDQFAERDFASSETKIQNDLDYYEANGSAQKLKVGDKYGYDYYAHIRKAQGWLSGDFSFGALSANVGATIGYDSFWREGLVRKGLFPDDSKGLSEKSSFLTWSAKAGVAYVLKGGHRFSANAGYFNDAPTFSQAFISPRTRNAIVPDLTTRKTASADINYQYSNAGYNVRITGFWTTIKDQTDVMSFYDDSQNSFTNFAMSGIDERHMGVELGAKVPLPLTGLSLSGVLSLGEYIYTSTPLMTQTIDNSAEVVFENEPVTYWQSTPIFKKVKNTDGVEVYEQDMHNEYVIDGYQKHYIPSTPQIAAELALNYNTSSYWFIELNAQYYAKSYLDMNPLYRTKMACGGADGIVTPEEVTDLTTQENLFAKKDAQTGEVTVCNPFLLNCSVGKSWYLHRKYQFGFSLQVNNMLNNTGVKTGGYEQTRLISSTGKDRYYAFDPKYFYMQGANYMLNLYFKF